MKTKINLAIQNILAQKDYIENNDNELDGYYDCIGDMFTYNDQNVIEKIKQLIDEQTDIELSVIENNNLFKHFVKDVIYDIATNEYNFILSRNYDSYGCLYDYDLFGMDAGEQEIQIFNNCEYKLTGLAKNYVENKTDTVISGDYAYYVGYSSVTCSLNVDECIELVNDTYTDLLAENSDFECYTFNAIDLYIENNRIAG